MFTLKATPSTTIRLVIVSSMLASSLAADINRSAVALVSSDASAELQEYRSAVPDSLSLPQQSPAINYALQTSEISPTSELMPLVDATPAIGVDPTPEPSPQSEQGDADIQSVGSGPVADAPMPTILSNPDLDGSVQHIVNAAIRPSPMVTPVAELNDNQVRLTIDVDKTQFLVGDIASITVTLAANGPRKALGFLTKLDHGIAFVSASSPQASYDAKSRTLYWNNIDLGESGLTSVSASLQITSQATRGKLKLAIEPLVGAQKELEYLVDKPLVIRLADSEVLSSIDDRGGTVNLDNGKVRLAFAPGSVRSSRDFAGGVFTNPDFLPGLLSRRTLLAMGEDSPLSFVMSPDTQFEVPVTATIDLSTLFPAELDRFEIEPRLYYLKPETIVDEEIDATGKIHRSAKQHRVLELVESSVWDVSSRTLTAQLEHFSAYGVGFVVPTGKPEPWKLAANFGEVSMFRGSSGFSTIIDSPEFPQGPPSLSIGYSSAGADSVASDSHRLGAGWSLNGIPRILRTVRLKKNGYQVNGVFNEWFDLEYESPDAYRLSLGGNDYNLVYKGSALGGDEFVPQNYTALRVYRCKVGTVCNNLAASVTSWPETMTTWRGTIPGGQSGCATTEGDMTPADQYYWQVWTPDGTRYLFGTSRESTTFLRERGSNITSGSTPDAAYSAWYVTRIGTPLRDNTAGDKWTADYVYSEEPLESDDGKVNGVDCSAQGGAWDKGIRLVQIRYGNSTYVSNSRVYSVSLSYEIADSRERLGNITVWGNGSRIRRYQLLYGGMPWNWRVTSIVTQGWDGSSWLSLPATTFEYVSNSDVDPERKFNLVSAINNGYGGRVEYAYYWWNGGAYNTVQWRRLMDGVGNTSEEVYEFVDSTKCLNNVGSPCYVGRDSLYPDSRGGLVGYGQSWKTVRPLNGAALSVVRFDSHTDKRYLGKVYDTRFYNAAKTVVSSASRIWFGMNEPAPGQPAGTWQVWESTVDQFPTGDLNYVVNTTSPPVGTLMTRRNHVIDAVGSVTRVIEYGYLHTSGDERSIHRKFSNWNGPNFIIGVLLSESVFDGVVETNANGPSQASQTLYSYDSYVGSSPDTQVVTLGRLTRVQRGRNGVVLATQQASYDPTTGALTQVTDANNNASTAGYDSATLKVLWTKNALLHQTSYNYFGINGVGLPAGQPFGGYHYVIDPNGSMLNRVWYDVFGRVTKVIQQGDTDTYPTEEFKYQDGVAPFKVTYIARSMPGIAWWSNQGEIATWQRTYYDGLGRAIQTHSPHDNWVAPVSWSNPGNIHIHVVNTRYDASGRLTFQSVPYLLSDANVYQTVATPKGTVTAYDLLGRVTVITGPDGQPSRLYYESDANTLRTRSVDANNHVKVSAVNGLGNTVRAEEYAGTYPNESLYAAMTYQQRNATGLLERVTDAASNVTQIEYDAIGRKVVMTDTDMGIWRYGYDANSNLVSQLDAKNQRTCMYYDSLNRLIGKYYPVSGQCPADPGYNGYHMKYYYDEASFGASKGRRTQAQAWPGGVWSNTLVNTYDARGRIATIRRHGGSSFGDYTTRYTYDSAGRVITQTNPDNEVITNTYKIAGFADGLRGGSNQIVQNTSYNVLGKVQSQNFGNGLRVQMRYMGVDIVSPPGFGDANWGRLRQICVLPQSPGGNCYDWTFNTTGTQATKLNVGYWYDAVGNIANFDEYDKGYGTSYSYDALDRLLGASGALAESYSYSAIGNITSKTGAGTFSYLGGKPHAVTHLDSVQRYWYDANGNMEWRTERNRTYRQYWNAENRLSGWDEYSNDRVTALSVVERYYYDADGTRVAKTQAPGVALRDYFENGFDANLWRGDGAQTIVNDVGNSVLRTTGPNNGGWPGVQRMEYSLSHGRSAEIDFKVSVTDTVSHFMIHSEDGDARWAIVVSGCIYPHYIVNSQNTGWQAGPCLLNPVVPNRWYHLSLRVDDSSSGFMVWVRERDNPSVQATWSRVMPVGKRWKFDHSLYRGQAFLDHYREDVNVAQTTVYVGPHFEKNMANGETISYYYFGGQRVAMRLRSSTQNRLLWLHGDMLGSASEVTDSSGALVGSTRYTPYGSVRTNGSALAVQTNRRFTGQASESNIGLYDYNARFYDPLIGRFISADTIVPGAGNPQAFNRYSYVLNRPLNYTDPSGHCASNGDDWCTTYYFNWNPDSQLTDQEKRQAENRYFSMFSTPQSLTEDFANHTGGEMMGVLGLLASEAFVNWSPEAHAWWIVSQSFGRSVANAALWVRQLNAVNQVVQWIFDDTTGSFGAVALLSGVLGPAGKLVFQHKGNNPAAYLESHGWTEDMILETINGPSRVGAGTNKLPGPNQGGRTWWYFDADGEFVVVDEATGHVLQVSQRGANYLPPPDMELYDTTP